MLLRFWELEAEKRKLKRIINLIVMGTLLMIGGRVFAQDTHEYVDLGLPSGTLWATCNVGANAPEEFGDYFAWGETAPKDVYNWSTYQYYDGSNLAKYTGSDGLTILLPEDDAATTNWGNEWRMPTKEEWQELLDNTTNKWTTQNGVNGRLFTGSNGNSLFLPAVGFRWDNDLNYVGSYGYYWSSSLNTDGPNDAWLFDLYSDYYGMYSLYRGYGQSVRAVYYASVNYGNVEIPEGMSNTDIIITNFSEDAIPDENGDFSIGYSKMLVAKNINNGEVIYYSLNSIENNSKNTVENDYEVSAKETALTFALRLLPFYMKDGYDDVLDKVKESVSALPCVEQLEEAIRNTVNTYGYLKEDEISSAIHNVFDFFYNEFMSLQVPEPETKDKPSPTKLDPPYFSPNHRHGVRLNINETHFLEDPQRWSINCTGYSSLFSALGIVEGYLNENDFFIKSEGRTPYWMPPMGMSQYAKLAENVAFMTMPGNWAGLSQLYRKVKQAINDPDYLLELTHVTYENMTFEIPRTANAIGVLTPLDDDDVAVATAAYMAYDLVSLIPTVGAYPIESIVNAYLQDGDFVNLVRTQRHNGEEGWSMIVEAMYDRIDEITQAIAPDIPLDIINSLTPIGTVCGGLDLFLAEITICTLGTFALPVVTDFPILELPEVVITYVENVTGTTAQVNGRVVSIGSHSILERGVCYSTSPVPTYEGGHVEATLPTTYFSCLLEDLQPNTRYYVRAYAINELGYISYSSNEISFYTVDVPNVTTLQVTNIATTSATANASLTFSNMSQIIERGFLYDTSPDGLWLGNVGCDGVVYEGPLQNDFSCSMTGLYPYTEYYVRAYAKIAEGIGYGEIVSFTTHTEVPLITTYPLNETDITSTSAIFHGKVEGLPSNLVMTRGFMYNTSPYVNISQPGVTIVDAPEGGTGEFTVTATGLTPNTTYYYLAYIWMSYPGTDQVEIFHGPELYFTTLSVGGGDDHDYVDLGLPSGLLWATCNVGANAPEEYGDYFAWGETQPKDVYNWDTYQYYGSNLTKYTGYDGLTILQPEDDAATANWGNGWRMPTKEEWEELYQNTTSTWTTQNGVNGRLFTGPNGNSLFLPAAGYRQYGDLLDVGYYGYYWSSSLYTFYPRDAWYIYFFPYDRSMNSVSRGIGLSVRAVRSARQN